jgi:hypothetical protein
MTTMAKHSMPWKKRQLTAAAEQMINSNPSKFQHLIATSNSTATIPAQSRMTGLPPTAKSSSNSNLQLPPQPNLPGTSSSTVQQHPVPWKKPKLATEQMTNANPPKLPQIVASISTATIPTQQSRMTGLPPTTKIKQLKQRQQLPTMQQSQNVAIAPGGGLGQQKPPQQQTMMKTEQQSPTKQPPAIAIVHPHRQQQYQQQNVVQPINLQRSGPPQQPQMNMGTSSSSGAGISGGNVQQQAQLLMELARLYQQQQMLANRGQQQQQQMGSSSNA